MQLILCKSTPADLEVSNECCRVHLLMVPSESCQLAILAEVAVRGCLRMISLHWVR